MNILFLIQRARSSDLGRVINDSKIVYENLFQNKDPASFGARKQIRIAMDTSFILEEADDGMTCTYVGRDEYWKNQKKL